VPVFKVDGVWERPDEKGVYLLIGFAGRNRWMGVLPALVGRPF
jgi:hypothetical protein